ncbi:M24 family metallopeptidase [Enterococcus sp. AZ103]|uniref:M24 family metallopeptidase n=1 Tax=Enterococcus sp. AZ103 TaxID=2774628 RepID=UPI003F296568
MTIQTKKITSPQPSKDLAPIDLTDETLNQRRQIFLTKMKAAQLDAVVIYADREHGANFEYFTGFIPRFEEACLVLHQDGKAFLLLGNENTKMGKVARLENQVIHVPFFSLPNQPMLDDAPLSSYFAEAGLKNLTKVGVIGWKMFTSSIEDNRQLFDIPHYILQALQSITSVENVADLLLSPIDGLRVTNNANEIAHYSFGASLAGNCLLETLNQIELNKTELAIATSLSAFGQQHNVTTICATGERFSNATLYPRNKQTKLGDTFSLTTSYKGGLSSRAAFVANNVDDLPEKQQDYLEKVAYPYYQALVTWLKTVKLGLTGATLFTEIDKVLPQKDYHWELNPGHFVADEEWLSSPFAKNSSAVLQSGQLLQIDLIPKVAGYAGVGCEDGICLADATLREEIKRDYPKVWADFTRRRDYLAESLNIELAPEILPMSDTVAYYRPFLLNQELAFYNKE